MGKIILNPYNQGDCTSNNITSLNIFNFNKKLEKVVDVLGKEVNRTTNRMLFNIYDDGSVRRSLLLSKISLPPLILLKSYQLHYFLLLLIAELYSLFMKN